MATKISRRQFNILMGAASVVGLGNVRAADKPGGQLVVGTWGGDYEKFLRNYIATPFLDPQGIKTVFDTGNDAPRKIKLMAERRLPRGTMDIAALTGSGGYEMWKNDTLQELDLSRIPGYADIPDFLRTPYSVPHIYTGRVILYNPEIIKTEPTSYNDLWNPDYAGKVGIIDIQYQTTIESAALINGGSLSNYEPGKEKLLELKKTGVRIYPTNEAMAQALSSGECAICIMWQARARQWQSNGIPVKIAYPKEGVGIYVSEFSIPKNARNPDAAYAFLNASLQPQAQLDFAKNMGYQSPSTTNRLPAELAERVSIPQSQLDKVMMQDNEYLLKNDAQLQDWWNKVFKA